MNIIELAVEVGLLRSGEGWTEPYRWGVSQIEHFAELVAEAEREACAQVCEARFMGDLNREDQEARRCAEAIRNRGENKPSGSYVLWDNTQCNALAPAREQAKRAWEDGYESGRLAEREACAKLCEQMQDWPEDATPYDCAKAIRARKGL